ncbi:MAG: lytic transglycosylase domain-containing protein [Synergistaceae bacterium]|nr:lytic transglycosylase domain-containing protein [Synergistaceae bacterium]
MIKKIITFIAMFIVFIAPCSPVYSSGLPEDISISSSNKDVPLDLALEWLRGETELPKELDEIPITVPLMKPDEKIFSENYQVNAISHVFLQHNKQLDNVTANEYANIIRNTSEKFGEDPFIIAALVVVESSVQNDALSKGGDFGLMQVRWKVHKNKLIKKYPTIKTEIDMFKPKENITAGTEIFSNYRKSADGDIKKAMVAYSGGSSTHWTKVNNVVSQIKAKYNEFSNG